MDIYSSSGRICIVETRLRLYTVVCMVTTSRSFTAWINYKYMNRCELSARFPIITNRFFFYLASITIITSSNMNNTHDNRILSCYYAWNLLLRILCNLNIGGKNRIAKFWWRKEFAWNIHHVFWRGMLLYNFPLNWYPTPNSLVKAYHICMKFGELHVQHMLITYFTSQ